jgi:hypothetical protein
VQSGGGRSILFADLFFVGTPKCWDDHRVQAAVQLPPHRFGALMFFDYGSQSNLILAIGFFYGKT